MAKAMEFGESGGGEAMDCVNVRYLRSYIDDAAYELSQGKELATVLRPDRPKQPDEFAGLNIHPQVLHSVTLMLLQYLFSALNAGIHT